MKLEEGFHLSSCSPQIGCLPVLDFVRAHVIGDTVCQCGPVMASDAQPNVIQDASEVFFV